ncbi:hypothetical protein [Herbiconiux ginsengi]|uniref:Uncharacterized protein n=1 Tax=Herbiconiux ginsengi TaxID=381665 RepID=A0A1H3SPS7_9MICO|nr:hypothetical protein [Herbiconiux ginsengi]SDZ39727.1 hypothetical protein SAMN05216554_3546 [Herbiconiux ginsengi]
MTDSRFSSRRALVAAASFILLTGAFMTGCASTTPSAGSPGDGGVDSADAPPVDPAEADAGAAAGCDDIQTAGWELFSDPAMSAVPEPGAVFGDGSELAFQYDGHDESASPTYSYQLGYIQDDGAVIAMGGGNMVNDGGALSVADQVFESNADGHAGVIQVEVTQNVKFENGAYTGDDIDLGRYCIAFSLGS